ncbi:MAG: glutathione S-transferase family protein [Alphaproteobacteria bacterium]|nr:glutathione S-transferase family protein [Alphaproteobacteria bacterium]
MAKLVLVIGSRNYSSWSLRPWLALKQAGADFHEILIDLDDPDKVAKIRAHSPAGKVPVLKDGPVTVWESLAICEYAAELFPRASLWPVDRAARAHARAVSTEMHSGFPNLRSELSMNILNRSKRMRDQSNLKPETWADVTRIFALWQDCRRRFGKDGPFLFGAFTNADAMYAPVVTRFRTYQVPLPAAAKDYCDAVWALPAMQEWTAAAKSEPRIARYDVHLDA